MIISSFHGVSSNSCIFYSALHDAQYTIELNFDWKRLLLGLVSAVKYLHDQSILHNNIKCENVLIESKCSTYNSILIDFGNA